MRGRYDIGNMYLNIEMTENYLDATNIREFISIYTKFIGSSIDSITINLHTVDDMSDSFAQAIKDLHHKLRGRVTIYISNCNPKVKEKLISGTPRIFRFC